MLVDCNNLIGKKPSEEGKTACKGKAMRHPKRKAGEYQFDERIRWLGQILTKNINHRTIFIVISGENLLLHYYKFQSIKQINNIV